NPGFTTVAIITLALGIGANSAMFSVVKAVLLKPLPFSSPDRLVAIRTLARSTGFERDYAPYRDVADWRGPGHSFVSIGAHSGASLCLPGAGEPEALYGARVSSDLFPAFGVQPAIGRNFLKSEDEPGADHVVILSHDLWVRRFGGDPEIVGRKVNLANLEDP